MFNLLLTTSKETIRREYRLRLVVVILWFLFGTFVVASVLLLPSFFLSLYKEKAAEERADILTQSIGGADTKAFDEALEDMASRLALVGGGRKNMYLYELLRQVAGAAPATISLSNFSVSGGGEGEKESTRRIDLAGVAADRAALLAFGKALEALGLFDAVDIPISNFASDTNIIFSLHATGTF